MTLADIAEEVGITENTLLTWRKEKPLFRKALAKAQKFVNAKIEKSLYERARGYKHKETIIHTYKGRVTDKTNVIKHYPPETQACLNWLYNKDPSRWKAKQEIEVSNIGEAIRALVGRFGGE
jgi:hypothetical protein